MSSINFFPKLSKNKPKKSDSKKKPADDFNRDPEAVPPNVPTSSSSSSNNDTVHVHWTFRTADSNRAQVLGFENDILALKKLLGRNRENKNQFKAVAIVGTRGVGKTTLCQEYVEKCVEEDFHRWPRVWVSMSRLNRKDDPKIEILKRMCQSLGVEDEKITNTFSSNDIFKALPYILRLQLIGKRYLIVLDDACELSADQWYDNLHESVPIGDISGNGAGTRLASALPKGSGGTVIVTSRAEDIAKKMAGEANVHRVLPLSGPENIWLIFCDTVIESDLRTKEDELKIKEDELRKKLEELKVFSTKLLLSARKTDIMIALKEKVIMTSNGVPVAAKEMAKTMHELLNDQLKKQAAEQEKKKIESGQVQKERVPTKPEQIQEEKVTDKEEPLADKEVPRETNRLQ